MTEREPTPSVGAESSNRASRWAIWLAVFASAFAVYATTANRGAQWQDSGFHILRAVTKELVHPSGLALTHPLHHWLARCVVSCNLLEPCFAVTLLSAFAAALAVANIYGCVMTLTRRLGPSLFAAASFGLAHTVWQMATIAETYTLTAALLSAECWCLAGYAATRRRACLYGSLLLNGLGVANHMLASLTTPVLVIVLVHALCTRKLRAWHALFGIGLWVLGSLPYTLLVATEWASTGDFVGTLHSALFGRSFADEVLNTTVRPRTLLTAACFVTLNFPNLLLPAAVYGLVRIRRLGVPPPARPAFVAALLIHACFAVRYRVVDQHTFFLPIYVLLSIFGGVGFAGISQWLPQRTRRILMVLATTLLVLTPLTYAAVPSLARRLQVLGDVTRDKPYRDDYVYVFTPWSAAERSAERMSRHAVELAGENGLILIEDPMAEYAVRYRALRDEQNALQITRDVSAENIASAVSQGRTVVLVPARVGPPRTEPLTGSWRRVGDLYILVTGSPG